MASVVALGGAAVAATATVGVGGWAHLQDKLSNASHKVTSMPTLSVEAYAHPFDELTRQEKPPLACVANVDGRDAYVVCSGEVLLVGTDKDNPTPRVALGGASVSRQQETLSVAAAGGEPCVSLTFARADEAAKWFKELRDTAERRPPPALRLNQMHGHLLEVRRGVIDLKEAHVKRVRRLITDLRPLLAQLDEETSAKATKMLQDLLDVEAAAANQKDHMLAVLESDISLAKPASAASPAPGSPEADTAKEPTLPARKPQGARSRSKDGAVSSKNVKFMTDHTETHQKLKSAVSLLADRHVEALKALSGSGVLPPAAPQAERDMRPAGALKVSTGNGAQPAVPKAAQATRPAGTDEDLEHQLSMAKLGRQRLEAQVNDLKRQLQARQTVINPDLELVKLHEKIVVLEEKLREKESRCSGYQMQLKALSKGRAGLATNGNAPVVDIEMEQLKKRAVDAETDKTLLQKKLFQVEQALVEQTAIAKEAIAAKEEVTQQATLTMEAIAVTQAAPADDGRVARLTNDLAESKAKERGLEQEIAQLKAQVEVHKVAEAEWASSTDRHNNTVMHLQAAHRQEKEHHADTMRQLEVLRTSESKLKARRTELEQSSVSVDKRIEKEKEELRKRLTTEFETEYAMIRQQLSQTELSAQMSARQVAQLTEERDAFRELQLRNEGYRQLEEVQQLEGQLADAHARQNEIAADAQRNLASMTSAHQAQMERIRSLEGELVEAKIGSQQAEALEVELHEVQERLRMCEGDLVEAKMDAQKSQALQAKLIEATEKLRMYEENNALKSQISAVLEQINNGQARVMSEDKVAEDYPSAGSTSGDVTAGVSAAPSAAPALVNNLLQAQYSSPDLTQTFDTSNTSVPPTPSTSIVTGNAAFQQSPSRFSTAEFSSVGPPPSSSASLANAGSVAVVPTVSPQLYKPRPSVGAQSGVASVEIPMAARVVPGTGLEDIERSGWAPSSTTSSCNFHSAAPRLSGSMPHCSARPNTEQRTMLSPQRPMSQQVVPAAARSHSPDLLPTSSGSSLPARGSPNLPQRGSMQVPCLQPPSTSPQLRPPTMLPGQYPAGYTQQGLQQLRAPSNPSWNPSY